MTILKKIFYKLNKKKLKISVVESCTGGLLSAAMTSMNGSSKIFDMGLTTYSNDAKNKILKVPKKIIKKYGSVSMQCCLSMLNNLNKINKKNICVAITGIAGPKGGTRLKPVGLVYIGVKKGKIIKVNKIKFPNKGRNYIRRATVTRSLKIVLNLISSE